MKGTPLCKGFADQAIQTWLRIQNEIITGISFGEETITDVNLQDLQIKYPYDIKIKKFNRRQEAKNGADWEWWFVANGLAVGMRLQAKKLRLSDNVYPDVDRSNRHGRQIDLLIQESNNATPKVFPVYVFYNYIANTDSTFPWNCKSYPVNYQELGCSVVPASKIVGMNITHLTIDDIKNVMLPWHCLVCCQGYLHPSDDVSGVYSTLPYRVYGFLQNAFNTPEEVDLHSEEFRQNREQYVTKKLPWYVNALMDQGNISSDIGDEIDLEGVMIIEEKPSN